MRRGLFLAPFDELVDPRLLADLAANAEARGWDGMFFWDHVAYPPPVRALADPWVALAGAAAATSRLRLGPMVTPLARRRVHKLARETVTLDLLSGGRVTLGVGLGSERTGELEQFGEVVDGRERARILDDGLQRLSSYWAGELEPVPIQRPRIPVWVAARWPHRRPLRRAARWDGLFAIEMPDPGELVRLAEEIRELRNGSEDSFDLVVEVSPGTDSSPWAAAGATWALTGFGSQPREAEVRAVIEHGPS